MTGLFIVLGIFVFLIGTYFLSYYLNGKTSTPEGAIVVDKCSTCGTSGACALKDAHKEDECEFPLD